MSKLIKLTGNNSCCLDTSIIVAALRNDDGILQRLNSFDVMYVSNTVMGELYFGAYNSANHVKHLQNMDTFLANCLIIYCNSETSIIYGRIKAILSKKGRKIPENDIWIAAVAIQHSLPLYTLDKHFINLEPHLLII